MRLSIIIPAYNEKKTLLKVLKSIEKVDIGFIEKEIIIVDDFSTDGTKELLETLKEKKTKIIYQKMNCGKGFAIRTGLSNSTGDIILIQDADLEYNPKDYNKLLKPILFGNTQVVYGSRFMNKNQKIKFNSFFIGNKFLSLLTTLLYRQKITDMETCYKVFKKEAIKDLKLKSRRFEFEPEITAKILKKKVKILEIPISYNPRGKKEGKKIKCRDGIIAIWTLIKYWFVK
jgi:dolichol-phosphate mannosyltransferase